MKSELQNVSITYIGEGKGVESFGGLNTSLERMTMSTPRENSMPKPLATTDTP